MLEFSGTEIDRKLFEPFVPLESLYDFGGPRIFVFANTEDDIFLAYQFEEDNDSLYYLIVPTSDSLVRRLKRGDITVRDSLSQPRMWMIEVDGSGTISAARKAAIDRIPDDWLPDPDAMLWPSLQPIISVRSIGDRIKEGVTPGSVVRNLIDGAEKAVKVLLEYSMRGSQQAGRPVAELRRLYDLPPQRFAFRSFEVSFRPPARDGQVLLEDPRGPYLETQDEIYRKVGEMLERGLEWAGSSSRSITQVSDNPEESRAILRALTFLAPSAYGLVESVEVRGRLAGRFSSYNPARLDQALRSDIKKFEAKTQKAANQLQSESAQVIECVGKIRAADKDDYKFDLRYIQGYSSASDTIMFIHEEDVADDAYYAWNSGHEVRVIGIRERPEDIYRAILIIKAESGTPDMVSPVVSNDG